MNNRTQILTEIFDYVRDIPREELLLATTKIQNFDKLLSIIREIKIGTFKNSDGACGLSPEQIHELCTKAEKLKPKGEDK